MPRTIAWLCLCLAMIALAGCRSPMQRLDQQVADMINQRQAETFGADAPNDPHYLSPAEDAVGSGDLYDTNPATNNPAVDQLPAATDPDPHQIDPEGKNMPSMLDAAEDAVEMDLQDVLAYAIEHAPTYRNRKEDLYLSVLSLIAERHLWGPRFFDTITSRYSGTPERGDYDTSLSLVNELGVTQRLPYGGSIGASALVNYVNYLQNEVDTPGDPREEQSSSVELSLDLPLLRGAGMAAREDLIQSERNVIYAVRSFERFRRTFMVDLANSYFELIRRQGSLTNQRVQVDNLQLLYERYQAFANAGKVPGFDAENTKMQVLFARNNLLNAEESYAAAVDAFKLQIGFPTTGNLVIKPLEIEAPVPLLDSAASVRTAWELRLDLQTQHDQVDDAQRGVRVAQNGMLPDLDLSASVSAPSDIAKQRGGFDLDLGEGDYQIGATLALPLDRLVERTRLRRAQIDLEQQKRSYQLSRDQIALQVRRTVRSIEQARITLQLQEQNVFLAERRLEGLHIQEEDIQPREIIDAEEDLLSARDRRESAVADLRSNVLQYLLDTGQMRVAPDGRWLAPVKLASPTAPPAEADSSAVASPELSQPNHAAEADSSAVSPAPVPDQQDSPAPAPPVEIPAQQG
ncbi:MAG: TolC family protein [Phycisphaeraceae bacterium]|nr:TolC family protein [Phycisphaeraceae bacterium]